MPFVFEQEIEQPKERFVFEDPEPAFEDPRLYGIPEGAGEPISTITGKPLLTDFGKPKKADVPAGRFVFEESKPPTWGEVLKKVPASGLASVNVGLARLARDTIKLVDLPAKTVREAFGIKGERPDVKFLEDYMAGEQKRQKVLDVSEELSKLPHWHPKRIIGTGLQAVPQVAAVAGGALMGAPFIGGATSAATMLGAIAYGPSAEEAKSEGANEIEQILHGITAAEIEVLTELPVFKAVGKIWKHLKRSGVAKKAGVSFAKRLLTGLGIYGKGLALETAQEVEAYLGGQVSKRLHYDPNATINFKDAVEAGYGGLSMAATVGIAGVPGMAVKLAGKGTAKTIPETEPTIPEETRAGLDREGMLNNIKAALESGEITTDDVMEFARLPEAEGIVDDLNALITEAKEELAPKVEPAPLEEGTALTDEEILAERAKTFEEAPRRPAEISAEAFEREITEEERVKAKAEIEPDLNKFFKRAKEIPITPKQKDLLRGLTKEQAQKIAVQWNEIWKAGTETAKQARITEAETFVRERPDLFNLVHGLLMVKPTPAKPKTDVAPESAGVEIPTFKSTQEAYAFGEKATPEQVKELQRLVKVQDTKFNELKKAGKLQEAMDEAIKHQFYNEALQKVEGTEQYKKFKPEPKEVPKTGTETEKVEVTPEKKEAWEMTPKEWTQESLQPTIEKMKIGETKVLPDKRIIVKSSQDLTYGETYISRSPVKTKMLDPSEIDQLPDKIKNFVERYEAGEKDLPPIYVSELMVNPKTGETFREIRDGHHRYYMAEEVGLEELPAMERVSGLYPEEHEAIVRNALKKGENVPENVLAEYPDLKPQPEGAKPQPPKIEKPKPKLPRTEDLEGEGIGEPTSEQSISQAYEKLSKGERNTRVRISDIKAETGLDQNTLSKTLKEMQTDNQAVLYPFDMPSEITRADKESAVEVGGEPSHIVFMKAEAIPEAKPKPKEVPKTGTETEKVEVTKEDIEAFIKPLHHKYYLEGQNKGIAVEKLNAYGALQINKLVGSKLRANVDMDAVKQYLKEHPTKVEVAKKAGVEVTPEKKEPSIDMLEKAKEHIPGLDYKKAIETAKKIAGFENEKLSVDHIAEAIQYAENDYAIVKELPKAKKEIVKEKPVRRMPNGQIYDEDAAQRIEAIFGIKQKVEVETTPEGKEISVDLTKKEEAAVTPKQQKEYLLAEIDKAIEAEAKKIIDVNPNANLKDTINLLGKGELVGTSEQYTFTVPNDGEFEIYGSNLPEFQRRVKSAFPSTITSKKFKPKVEARKAVPTAKYNKILGKAAKDLKPADIDRIFKEVADTEARDITGAVMLNPFQNWLLSQDITKAVKDKIRSVAGKDYIDEARVKIETQDIEYAKSMVEYTRGQYEESQSYYSEYKSGEKTLKQIIK